MNDEDGIENERNKDHFVILLCGAFIVGRAFWHTEVFFDGFSFAAVCLAVFLIYKKNLSTFLSSGLLKMIKLGPDGFSLELNKKLENMLQESETEGGEGGMMDRMRPPATGSEMRPRMDPRKFVAEPRHHRKFIDDLLRSVGELKETLAGDRDCLLVEAVLLAHAENKVTDKTKALILEFNETLSVALRFPQFVTTGQIITLDYLSNRLKDRVKAGI